MGSKSKVWGTLILLVAIALAPLFVLAYYYRSQVVPPQVIASFKFESETTRALEAGAKFDIKACRVLDGYRFEMYLDSGKWIQAQLTVAAKDEAAPVVVDLLNKTVPPAPTVTLLRQSGNIWIVDLHLTVGDRRVSLVDHLRSRGLLL